MFGWFRASCPVDSAAKAWLEERLHWLSEEFPSNVFVDKPMILPTPEFFPSAYDGSYDGVRALLDQTCQYMEVAPEIVQMKLVSEAGKLGLVNGAGQGIADAAGTFSVRGGKYVIRIDKAGLDDTMGLVGTIAHELAHARLLGEDRVSSEVFDHELLTDLTVVFHGLGIFLANTPRVWPSHFTRWPDTELKKPEYMTPPMFGHALAHVAWHRDDLKPAWARFLNLGARTNFKQGLRYLRETKDSLFLPWHLRLG